MHSPRRGQEFRRQQSRYEPEWNIPYHSPLVAMTFSNISQTPSTNWHTTMLPHGASASTSQETDLQTRHRSLLRHLLIVPRQFRAQRNLTRVSRPQPILSPICCFIFGTKTSFTCIYGEITQITISYSGGLCHLK